MHRSSGLPGRGCGVAIWAITGRKTGEHCPEGVYQYEGHGQICFHVVLHRNWTHCCMLRRRGCVTIGESCGETAGREALMYCCTGSELAAGCKDGGSVSQCVIFVERQQAELLI